MTRMEHWRYLKNFIMRTPKWITYKILKSTHALFTIYSLYSSEKLNSSQSASPNQLSPPQRHNALRRFFLTPWTLSLYPPFLIPLFVERKLNPVINRYRQYFSPHYDLVNNHLSSLIAWNGIIVKSFAIRVSLVKFSWHPWAADLSVIIKLVKN